MKYTEKLSAALAAIAQADEPMLKEAAAHIEDSTTIKVALGGGLMTLLKNIARFGKAPSGVVRGNQVINNTSVRGVLGSILRPNRALLNYNRQYLKAPGRFRKDVSNIADVVTHGLITLPMMRKGLRKGREAGTAEGLQQAFGAAQAHADSLPFMERIGLVMGRNKQASVGGVAKFLMQFLGVPIAAGMGGKALGKGMGHRQGMKGVPSIGLNPGNLNFGEKLRYALTGVGGGQMAGIQ